MRQSSLIRSVPSGSFEIKTEVDPAAGRRTGHLSTMTDFPPLPKLTGDIILDVFTHKSLRFGESSPEDLVNDNERLAELGAKVLNMTTTSILFDKRPPLPANDITSIRQEHLADQKYETWVVQYGLKSKLRYLPSVRAKVDSPEEARLLFNSYIGAVYLQSGLAPIQDWAGRIIDPDYQSVNSPPPQSPPPGRSPERQYKSPPPQPSHDPPALPPPAPQILALFNQTAAQNACSVSWQPQSTGPPHNPSWQVTCSVNGIEKGVGRAKSQKLAKEDAAKQAFIAMGWNST